MLILSLISINFNQNLKDKYNLLNLPTSENKSLNSISKEKNNLEKLDKNNFQNNKFQEFFNSLKNSKWSGHSYRAFQIFKDNILFTKGILVFLSLLVNSKGPALETFLPGKNFNVSGFGVCSVFIIFSIFLIQEIII